MKEQTRLQWWEWMMMMMIILMRIDVDDDNDEDDEDEDDADVSRDLDVNDHGFRVMEWKRNEECCRESVNFHLVLFCEQTIPWSNKRMMIHQFFFVVDVQEDILFIAKTWRTMSPESKATYLPSVRRVYFPNILPCSFMGVSRNWVCPRHCLKSFTIFLINFSLKTHRLWWTSTIILGTSVILMVPRTE